MLALYDGCLFSLLPFIFFREDAAGHMTKPCVFRRTRGDSPNRLIEFAVIGESVPLEVNRDTFKTEMDEIQALFAIGPD